MSARPELLGRDLQVVPPSAGVAAGIAATDSSALDLRSAPRPAQRPGSLPPGTPQRDRPEPGTPEVADLATIAGRENLGQALVLRLLTPRGALAALGHAGYGSRLHQLIGEHRNEAQRARCRAFVLEALAQEPRVAEVTDFAFDPASEGPSELRFSVAVLAVSGEAVTVDLAVGV